MSDDAIGDLIPQWLARNFDGCTPAELRRACRHLNLEAASDATPEGLTRKLLAHFDKWDDDAGPIAAEPPKVKSKAKAKPQVVAETPAGVMPPDLRGLSRFRAPQGLSNLSGWKGRRYRVRLQPRPKELGGNRKVPVPWEAETYMLDPRLPYQDIPAPVFYNLMDSQCRQLLMSWDANEKVMVKEWSTYSRYPIQYFGVTPGTEELPESALDWYIADCKANNWYLDEDRDSLSRIWGALTDGDRPRKDDRDMALNHYRYAIWQLLGLTPEQLEANEREAA